jgi:hypothetical protein
VVSRLIEFPAFNQDNLQTIQKTKQHGSDELGQWVRLLPSLDRCGGRGCGPLPWRSMATSDLPECR